MTHSKTLLCAAVVSLFTLVVPADGPAQERPDLSGAWALNVGESDDMRELPGSEQGGPPQAAGQRGGRRPGMGGGRGGRDRFGRGGGRVDPERVQQTMRLVHEGGQHISIVQNDSMVTITYADGSVLALRTNGKKKKVKVEGGGDIEIKAKWNKDDFVVERKVSGGGKIKETYLRPADRNQMYVIVEIEIGPTSGSTAFRRVYDLAERS